MKDCTLCFTLDMKEIQKEGAGGWSALSEFD